MARMHRIPRFAGGNMSAGEGFLYNALRHRYEELFGTDVPLWVKELGVGWASRITQLAVEIRMKLPTRLAVERGELQVSHEARNLDCYDEKRPDSVSALQLSPVSIGNIGRYQSELVEITGISDSCGNEIVDLLILRDGSSILNVSALDVERIAFGQPRRPRDFGFEGGMCDPVFASLMQASMDAAIYRGNGLPLGDAIYRIRDRMRETFGTKVFLGEIDLRVAEIYARANDRGCRGGDGMENSWGAT
jgi:hypothetical protein